MTEPPDEGDEELERLQRELDDFLDSEMFDELADDMMMDEIGRGEDHRTIYDDIPEVEDRLQDDLHDIREQTMDEPIPELLSVEEAKKAILDAKKKYDEKKSAEARAQSQQEEGKMPISDDAQRVAAIGNDETAAGAINEAKTDLEEAKRGLNLVGERLSAAVQKIQAAAEAVAQQSAEAGGLLGGQEGGEIQSQGQNVAEQCNNANQHIGTVDLGAIDASLQQTGLDGVLNQVQALYEAIKSAASKHQ